MIPFENKQNVPNSSIVPYVLFWMYCIVCTVQYVPYDMYRTICTVPCVPYNMYRSICIIPYVPYCMYRIACTEPPLPACPANIECEHSNIDTLAMDCLTLNSMTIGTVKSMKVCEFI